MHTLYHSCFRDRFDRCYGREATETVTFMTALTLSGRRMAVVLLKGCRELRPRQNYGRWVDVPHESAWLDDLSRAKDGALVHPRRGNTEAGCAVSTGFRASCEERRIIAAPAGTTFVARLVRVSIQGQRL